MDVLVVVLYLAVLIFIFFHVTKKNDINKKVQTSDKYLFYHVGKNYNLKRNKLKFFNPLEMSGKYNHYNIKVESSDSGSFSNGFWSINIKSPESKNRTIRISRRNSLDEMSFFGSKKDIKIGDKIFDERITLRSNKNNDIAALLDKNLRDLLIKLYDKSIFFEINENGLIVRYDKEYLDNSLILDSHIKMCLEIADIVFKDGDKKAIIIKNFRSEKKYRVKQFYFKVLMDNYKDDQEVKNIFTELRKSENAYDQIIAAPYLNKEGVLLLLKILKKNVLSSMDICAVIRFIESQKIENKYTVFSQLIKQYQNKNVKLAIIHAIGELNLSHYEDLIIKNIDDEDYDLRKESLNALLKCGTMKSVEKLREISQDSDSQIEKAKYQRAIDRIQTSLGNVSKGWVSVEEVADLDGALSEGDSPTKGSLSRERN